MHYLDGLIFFGGWLVGQLLFKGYEAHVSLSKKASKLIFRFCCYAKECGNRESGFPHSRFPIPDSPI